MFYLINYTTFVQNQCHNVLIYDVNIGKLIQNWLNSQIKLKQYTIKVCIKLFCVIQKIYICEINSITTFKHFTQYNKIDQFTFLWTTSMFINQNYDMLYRKKCKI